MAHENLQRHQNVEGSSDRAFGVVFAAFFAIIACWPLFHGQAPRWWALALGAIFLMIALIRPAALAPANRQWMRLGMLLGNIVGPIALAVLFYGVIAPYGLLMRLAGKDSLRLKRDAAAHSYWIGREPPGPPPNSLTNQF